MARYKRSYVGEKRTAALCLHLTPTERGELKKDAAGQGAASVNAYARELLFRRSAAVVAATRRNPEADAIMRELRAVGVGLAAPGNNLNQLARQLNTTGDLRDWSELRDTLEAVKEATELVKRAVGRVLDL